MPFRVPEPIRRLAAHRPRLGGSAAMVAAAVAFGLAAVAGVRGHLDERLAAERERLAPPHIATVDVVVAKRDLAAGAVVDADTMAVRALPADGLPGTAVRPDAFAAFSGGRLLLPLRAGEPLLAAAVGTDEPSALAVRVRAGVRAITIAVDEVNSLSGLLQPGDRIDLLLSARLPPRAGHEPPTDLTVPLMQDVAVLATGRQVRSAEANPSTPAGSAATGSSAPRAFGSITIEATPEQAQRLIVAQRAGRLTAMLRNPVDRGAIDRTPMDIARVLGAAPAAAAPRTTEVIVGGRGALERRSVALPDPAAASPSALPGSPALSQSQPIATAAAIAAAAANGAAPTDRQPAP